MPDAIAQWRTNVSRQDRLHRPRRSANGSPAIVGRRLELAAVDAALDAATEGGTARLAVTGEPGIGKTALLHELRRRAEARGFATVAGTALEAAREASFVFLGDVVEETRERLPPDRVSKLDDAWLAGLRAAVPSPAPVGLTLAEKPCPDAAVEGLVELLAAAGPLVVLLDDLHWADAASVDVVCRLLARPLTPGVVLVMAFRAGLLPAAVAAPVAAAVRHGGVTALPLDPLGVRESAQLLGPGVPRQWRTWVFREGGGNPFSMVQLERTRLVDGVPRAIAASVRAELERLPELALTVLRAAAVLGDPISPALVGEIAGCGGEAVHAALAALLDLDLLVVQGESGAHRFRQPILRRTVVMLTPPADSVRMNAQAAVALERRGGPLAARALHVSRAAERGDDGAIALLAEAGARSVCHAPAEAAQWLGAAIRLLPEDDRGRRLDLLRRQASALAAAGRLDACRAVLLAAIDGLATRDAVTRARLVGMLARVEHMCGEHEAARVLLERALAEIPGSDGPVACALRIELAVDRWLAREWEGIAPAAEEALDHARRLGDPAMEAEAAALRAVGEYLTLAGERAQPALDEAAQLLRRLPDDTLASALSTTLSVGFVALGLERHQDAVDVVRRGLAVAGATAQSFWKAGLLALLAVAELHRGRLQIGAATADEAVLAATALGVDQQLVWAHAVRGWIAMVQGDLESAMSSAKRAREALRRAPGSVAAGLPVCIMGAVLAEGGEPERAVAVLVGQAGGLELPMLPPSARGCCYGALLRAELAQGRFDEAGAWLARAQALVDRLPLQGRVGAVRLARAELWLARGDPERAAALAAAAVEDLLESGRVIDAARAELVAARALEAVGLTADARRRLIHARGQFAASGAEGLRQKAERALSRLADAPTGEGALAGLTTRQREVSLLIATGITNAEIAERLGLSVNTVERHVTRILERLGLSSRAALAAAVERSRSL